MQIKAHRSEARMNGNQQKQKLNEEFLSKERMSNLALLFQLDRFNRLLIHDLSTLGKDQSNNDFCDSFRRQDDVE